MLYISLLLLLVLTLIGLAVTRNTTFDQRMAAGQRDRDLAFQAAEAALRNGESMLLSGSAVNFNGGGYYDSAADITWETADWSGTGGDPAVGTLAYGGSFHPAPARMPRFYLVRVIQAGASAEAGNASDSPAGPAGVYRIIARGWGVNADDSVVLESTYEVIGPGEGRRLSWRELR